MSLKGSLLSKRSVAIQGGYMPASGIKVGIPRSLEIVLTLIALVLFAPLIGLAAAAIFLTSRGPVIFRQKRIGQRGRPFVLYKLRTMKVADEHGLQVTAANDSRVLPVGRWLRKAKVDELPELWNVLKGDMSLVGPRPEVPRYVDMNNPLWKLVLEARPGITDQTTLSLRNEETLLGAVNADREEFYLNTLQPFKLQGYLSYLRERSLWRDVRVLVHTCGAVVLPGWVPPPTIQGNSTKRG
jgi:lipopolysaccharide/colanic/teichoic acid biosynthesis glycosyltransferase